ncbi:potassium/sodium hyperpolarization-activated cyclic nucleotide-gated channel 1-like [Zophobas morio]|uniref:potassium/sodium hyperpolarization-activated cyclic nucleotide-gated channel 1-like n=1 Tax=Zophobas morio TaxID=2755281 RepID=UPI0030837793
MAAFLKATSRKIVDHPCQLECTQTIDTLIAYIDSGYFVKQRRQFRTLCLVSETSPLSKTFYKSSSEIHEEQLRQLRKYYYMIHPMSDFRIFWESSMIIAYLLLLTSVIPLELTFIYDTPPLIIAIKFLLDLICYIDVIMNFYTGYVIKQTRKVELDPKMILQNYIFGKHYVDGLFLVDVLSSIPVSFIMAVCARPDLYLLKLFLFLKLFRLRTMFRFIHHYFLRRKFWGARVRYFLLFVWFLLGIFWLSGSTVFIMGIVSDTTEEIIYSNIYDQARNMVDRCTVLIECVMLVGPDYMDDKVTDAYKLLTIFYIILGSFINMIILSQIISIYKSRFAARNKHREQVQEIEQFTRFKGISPDLRDSIIAHADFKYQRKILREAEIMNTLSEFLKEEVMMFKCQNLVDKVDFFKDLPPPLRIQIVRKLRPEVYLKNEVIFPIGSIGVSMFFIYVGSVGIYSRTGREVMQFGEGKHFGETTVISNAPRMFTAMARSDCELLGLRRSDIFEILMPYPALLAKIRSAAREKQKRVDALLDRLSTEEATGVS